MTKEKKDELEEKLSQIRTGVQEIIVELESTEKHAQFERIYGRSIAGNQLYSAGNHLDKMIMAIELEIKHQFTGML